ncbi:glycosyltransferase [Jatrophihabitans sp. YIM 134969]
MKIAQLAGWYSPVSGGIRTVVHRLAEGYHAAGHDTVLVVPGPHDTVSTDRITLSGPVLPGSGGYRLVIRPGVLGTALDRAAPDVVELHDKAWLPSVRRWADRRGVPVVLISHERLDRTLPLLVPGLPQPAARWTAERVRCMVQRRADHVVVCSAFAGAEFPEAHRVPLGVDLATFTPQPPLPDRAPGVQLVLASRLAREKRPDVAVATVAALRARGVDARLTVYGAGPLRDALQAQAVGLPVEFTGFTADKAGFARALAGADVVLAPGPAETFGLSALEALAAGTPVVAADGAAVAELLRTAQGFAGRGAALDGHAFADAVLDVLAQPETGRRAAARALAERYPWSRTVDLMLALHTATVTPSLVAAG